MGAAALAAAVHLTSPGPASASIEAAATPPSLETMQGVARNILAADVKAQENDLVGARTLLKSAVAAPAFAELPESGRHSALSLLATLEAMVGETTDAFTHAKLATSLPSATGTDWHVRLSAAFLTKDWPDAALSLQMIAEHWPASLTEISDQAVYRIVQEVWKGSGATDIGYGLLLALHDAGWRPQQTFESAEGLWSELALLQLRRHDQAAAQATVAALTNPRVLISMRIDRDYDALTAADPHHFDVDRGKAANLAVARAAAAAHPDKLAAQNHLIGVLISDGRSAEAMPLADATLAMALPADGSKSTFTDSDEVIWTMNHRADALLRLGRFDEAVEQVRKAAARPENGRLNVSQAINLGDFYYLVGRAAEARASVADVSLRDLSPYGVLAAEEVRVCAAAQLGDKKVAAETLAKMAPHAEDGAGPYVSALLCVDDLDTLEAFYLKRLADPDHRRGLLGTLQRYTLDPPNTPYGRVLAERRAELAARPRLKEAVEKVGRIESFSMSPLGN